MGYIFRKLSLKHTIELDRSNKQQKQLRNLCDNLPDGVFILMKSTSPVKKAIVQETKKISSRNVPDKESYISSSDQESNSAISLDPSFASFVNSTETLGEVADCHHELVFHNEALLKILGLSNSKELHAMVRKSLFVSRENGNSLSML